MAVDPLVDIVIPTWNGWEFLEPCLRSIVRQSFKGYTITVVDNGSTDNTVPALQQQFPEVVIVAFSENRGFSVAVNAGIRAGSHPLVFLLNNDTELAPDCLQVLVDASRENSNQFFAAKMLSFSDHSLLDGAGDSFLRGGAGYRLGTMEKDGGVYDRQREVFGACAGAALYRRSFFLQTGLFDEDFFAYLEDVDLNLRAARHGLRCLFVPKARVYHVGSATTGSKINPITVRLSTRNSLYVLLKNYSPGLLLRLLPVLIIYQCAWFVFCVKRGQLWAYLQGVSQGPGQVGRMRKKYQDSRQGELSPAEQVGLLKRAEVEVINSIMRRRTAAGKGNVLLRCYRFLFL